MIYVYKVYINIESGRPGCYRYVIQDSDLCVTLYDNKRDFARELLQTHRYSVYTGGKKMPTPLLSANWTDRFVGRYDIVPPEFIFRADTISLIPMVVSFTDQDINEITKIQSKISGGDRSFAVIVLFGRGYLLHHVATRTNYYAYDRVTVDPYKGRFGSGYTIDYHSAIKGCHKREYWIKEACNETD